jgi:Uma2 family endonuclease
MTYLEGALEIMSPSRLHENIKTRIARLLELFALERDIRLQGYGSMTLRHEPKGRGLEPGECYVLGPPQTEGFPDLAIEVSVTSGGIDKLFASPQSRISTKGRRPIALTSAARGRADRALRIRRA